MQSLWLFEGYLSTTLQLKLQQPWLQGQVLPEQEMKYCWEGVVGTQGDELSLKLSTLFR